jgi:hypothetical protein
VEALVSTIDHLTDMPWRSAPADLAAEAAGAVE